MGAGGALLKEVCPHSPNAFLHTSVSGPSKLLDLVGSQPNMPLSTSAKGAGQRERERERERERGGEIDRGGEIYREREIDRERERGKYREREGNIERERGIRVCLRLRTSEKREETWSHAPRRNIENLKLGFKRYLDTWQNPFLAHPVHLHND